MKASEDPQKVYADIIELPYRKNSRRKQMTLYERAAQFAPFAALTGYEAMVREEARLTEEMKEMSEYELELLDRKLKWIAEVIQQGEHPLVTVTHFVPDVHKKGGKYEKCRGVVRTIDVTNKSLILFGSDNIADRTISPVIIALEKIRDISAAPLKSME